MIFDFALIVDSIPKMLAGIGLTFQLLFLSGFLGLVLAVILLLMRVSNRWYLVAPSMVHIYVFRGTPILVQIFIIYNGLPQFEFIRDSIFWPILREPFGCAIVALSLNTGAYVSEILRGYRRRPPLWDYPYANVPSILSRPLPSDWQFLPIATTLSA